MPRTLGPTVRAVVSAVAAALLAVAGSVSAPLQIVVAVVLMLALAVGWPRLVDLPAALGRTVLLVVVALAAAGAALLSGDLRLLAVVAAGGVIGSFLLELARRDGRPRLVDSVSASMTGVVMLLSGSAWLVVGDTPLALAVVVTASGALAAGAAVSAIHLPPWPHAIATIVVATAVGAVAGVVLSELSFVGAGIGFAAGLLMASVHQVLGRYPTAGRPVAALAAAVLPVVVVGLPVYALARFYLI